MPRTINDPYPRSRFQLRILIPCTIALLFIADIALRFVPPQRLMFRAWEAAKAYRLQEPFAANFHYDNPRSYGDLANLGNLRALRQYHREVFTTDSFGYRITPTGGDRPVTMLVLGDSYAVGSGLSDGETLSAQLAALGHVGVYNGAGTTDISDIEALVTRLHFRNGLIVYKQWEDDGASVQSLADSVLRKLPRSIYDRSTGPRIFIGSAIPYSPLQIAIARRYRAFQDDIWLPNVSAKNVIVRRLRNGQQMLFLPGGISNPRVAQTPLLSRLSALASVTGNRLLVLLVPDKYAVYFPLLENSIASPSRDQGHGPAVPNAVYRVLDVTSILREQAASEVALGEYNYLIDDTHWNVLATRRTAQAILDFARSSR